MLALKKVRKLIENQSGTPAANTFALLVIALESEQSFRLADLYSLDFDDFALALQLMSEWRLDRYYVSKMRLLDVSVHHGGLDQAEAEDSAAESVAPAKVA
jgi:hypothetical protein